MMVGRLSFWGPAYFDWRHVRFRELIVRENPRDFIPWDVKILGIQATKKLWAARDRWKLPWVHFPKGRICSTCLIYPLSSNSGILKVYFGIPDFQSIFMPKPGLWINPGGFPVGFHSTFVFSAFQYQGTIGCTPNSKNPCYLSCSPMDSWG